jgi:superfamily II DNA or RNA helicase
MVNDEDNAILVATYGTASTGIDIPNLKNLILGFPFKAKIRLLQSIGRVLRVHDNKDVAKVFDIADNFNGKNYTLKQVKERAVIYAKEGFDFKMRNIKMKGKCKNDLYS